MLSLASRMMLLCICTCESSPKGQDCVALLRPFVLSCFEQIISTPLVFQRYSIILTINESRFSGADLKPDGTSFWK